MTISMLLLNQIRIHTGLFRVMSLCRGQVQLHRRTVRILFASYAREVHRFGAFSKQTCFFRSASLDRKRRHFACDLCARCAVHSVRFDHRMRYIARQYLKDESTCLLRVRVLLLGLQRRALHRGYHLFRHLERHRLVVASRRVAEAELALVPLDRQAALLRRISRFVRLTKHTHLQLDYALEKLTRDAFTV